MDEIDWMMLKIFVELELYLVARDEGYGDRAALAYARRVTS